MKEVILIFVGIILIFAFALSRVEDGVEMSCRSDCSYMGAEYIRHDLGVNGFQDTCSCKKDGEIKPIW